ncbi:MAG TPA: hypothetical protein VFF66_01320 [Brevundimonas sp.]|nr:hypothetical protein [Brevundimonas sp.]
MFQTAIRRLTRLNVGTIAVPGLLVGALIVVACLVVSLIFAAPRPASGEEFAAWVQAAGTIGAIIATAGVAWWVPWAAAKEREKGLRRTAAYYLESCAEALLSLYETLDAAQAKSGRMFGGKMPTKVGYNLSHYIGMLSSFPMHELPHADLPSAFLRMHNCLVRAGKVMDAYNAAVASMASFDMADSTKALKKVSDRAKAISAEFWKPPI